jgi:hypothetical protein
MKKLKVRPPALLVALGACLLIVATATGVYAQAPPVDPAAVGILKGMTDYLSGLQAFSVRTQNTLEDVLDSGHRIDLDVSASVTVSRPNQLRAERRGAGVEQVFYYNGKTLTLHNPSDGVYASTPAPGTVEEMIDHARETLGLLLPAADLIYRNAFPLLMEKVTLAAVVGKAFIGGVPCDHLLFSKPGVDFQVWISERGAALPYKYVVTDTATPSRLSITTVMSDWNAAPAVAAEHFTFTAPEGARRISFLSIETSSGADR